MISKPLINIHVFSPLSYSGIRSSIATEIAFFHAGIQVCSNLHDILSILSIISTKVNINFSSLRTSSSEYKTLYFENLCIFIFANSQYVKKWINMDWKFCESPNCFDSNVNNIKMSYHNNSLLATNDLEDMVDDYVFKTSSKRFQRNNFSSSKTSSRRLWKTSSRRLGRRKIVTLKTCWRLLQDISWRRVEDVLKTSTNVCGNVLNVEYCRTRNRLIMEKFPSMLTYYFLSGEMIWSSYELVQLNEAYNIWSLKYEGGF